MQPRCLLPARCNFGPSIFLRFLFPSRPPIKLLPRPPTGSHLLMTKILIQSRGQANSDSGFRAHTHVHTLMRLSHTKITEYLTIFSPHTKKGNSIWLNHMTCELGLELSLCKSTRKLRVSLEELTSEVAENALSCFLQPHKHGGSHLHILYAISHTHIHLQNDKLFHKCPHIPPIQFTHTKPTDAQGPNVYGSFTHVRYNQHSGIHRRLHVCLPTQTHTQIHPEQVSNTAKPGACCTLGRIPPTHF